LGVFLERPIAIAFIMVGLAVLIFRSVSDFRRNQRQAETASVNS